MREIKFRAWDKETNTLFTTNDLVFTGGKVFGRDTWYGKDVYSPAMKISELIMQYTGLKDKNGVDIYEGDIVKWNNDHEQLAKVEFIDFCFQYYMWGHDLYEEFSISDSKYIEVIGNIYENHELLK